MSQTSPPPGSNPYAAQSGNPYAAQPGQPPAAQPGQPPAAPQAGFPAAPGTPVAGPGAPGSPGVPMAPSAPFAPAAPAAPVRDNIGLGLAAALAAAVVAAGVYGAVIGLTEHEIGYAAVGVGFLIGLAAGRFGGRNPVLPVVSVLLSAASVYIGQLVGTAMIGAKDLGVDFSELFFDHFGLVQDAWKETADPLTFLFFAIAAYVAFQSTRKAGGL
ncbi:hypothetical protein ACFY93_01980 [Streptomyces sp. NPDC008313]|uniref:hypothetical protein n=1 Tax=Streptomyces sp. NPDC008313 TaxID=3364826 RepID=UPI0036E6E11B